MPGGAGPTPEEQRDPQPYVLSIGELAAATGMSVPALRAWEERYGFPAPHRTQAGGGHRRYSARDVATIQRVLERQAGGERLGEAVAAARAERRDEVLLSVFAEVTAAYPELPRSRRRKASVLATSRAIEDEVAAGGTEGHLFGCFQTVRHYAAARERWRTLAATTTTAHAFAHGSPGSGEGPDEVALVALPPDVPLTREWLVVHDGPRLAVALLARELPTSGEGGGERVFDVAWSVDPEVVRTAARRCAAAASAAGSEQASALLAGALSAPRRPAPSDRWVTERLVQRILAHRERG